MKEERIMKIHKFTVYVYGFNDNFDAGFGDVKELLKECKWDFIIHPYHEKTITTPYIGDGHPLNKQNLPKETWELYMDEELRIAFEEVEIAKKKFDNRKKQLGIE